MTSATFSTSLEAQQAAVLLESYRFELGNHDARQWVSLWLEFYRPNWIRDAVVEALYQGRYKSVSVRQILELWHRRGQPIRHVTHDFEAAICREFGEVKLAPIAPENLPLPSRHSSRPNPSTLITVPPPKAAKTLHASSTVSFNLAALSADVGIRPATRSRTAAAATAVSPGKSATRDAERSSTELPTAEHPPALADRTDNSHAQTLSRRLDNKSWRDFPAYVVPAYADTDADERLRKQRQLNGVLYGSARAIQPFKPALPFSAKTLRLAKQKAVV
ncbi:MAG: hypothetical protein WA885_14680 [Phormidesmis sp.]